MTEPAVPQQDTRPTTATPEGAQPEGGEGAEAAVQAAGWLEEEGAFVLPLGAGVRLASDLLGGGGVVDLPLERLPRIPGLQLDRVSFDPEGDADMITIAGKTNIPLTEEADFELKFGRDARPSGFDVDTKIALDWMGRPDLSVSWDPEGGVSVQVTIAAEHLVPSALRSAVTAEGDVTLQLANGALSGVIDTTVTLPDVIESHFDGSFGPEGLSGTIALTNRAAWLGEATGEGTIGSDGTVTARLQKTAGELSTPVPGLGFMGGQFNVGLEADGSISGGVTDLSMAYAQVAETTVNFQIDGSGYTGSADLALTIPGLSEASGSIAMEDGKLSGAFALGRDNFPEGLPLSDGRIEGTISETGALGFSGQVGISMGPAGTGQLQASYSDAAGFAIGATFDLSIPGLETASFTIGYDGTDITGEGEVAVDPALLSGIEGRVQISYAEGRWAGETTLGYSADNGKLAGEITVRVRQAEDDSLKVSGDGTVTAQIAPRLAGTLNAEIKEEGGIDVSGEIVVTEPLEMFPEQRFEKELLDVQTNIPLWAILVAVLRVRAGVRAGIGPGVFRDIRVTGSYTIGEEGEPSFAITGEMFIPAFVEGYVGFGAGLGASVVLGSLTGGIEAMGTAGLYGAISVVPELAYEDGDYSIEGVATMAAGARLKLSLNAWAEIEALWITVWENTWELASVTMPMGPDLGLEAKMAYTFGSPAAPTLDFNTSDVDTDQLISDAMPKDAPPAAGVREATQNEARWQGEQRAAGSQADSVPPELEAQAANSAPPVAAPAGGTAPNGPGAAPEGQNGPNASTGAPEGAQPTGPNGAPADPAAADQQLADAATPDPAAAGTVPDAEAADTTTPRHPQITVRMLDEPPVALPRSKTQQTADVRAAAEMVRLLAASGETTDTLDNYFPRIKERFKLGSIGIVMTSGGLSVLVKVNDEEEVPVDKEEVQRLNHDLIKDDPRLATRVTYRRQNAQYTSGGTTRTQQGMGVEMTAMPLTPLHDQGSGPKASALKEVFDLLETQGATGSQGYIKGHLLNDNLGGAGDSHNLFPITQTANTRHSAMIEELAKSLVNDHHYFVGYNVKMIQDGAPIPYQDAGGTDRVVINSTIEATLHVLNADLENQRLVKTVTIPSRFNRPTDGDGTPPAPQDSNLPATPELGSATQRELGDPATHGKSFTPAQGRTEIARRTRVSGEFLARAENVPQENDDTDDLIRSLQDGTDTQAARQDNVDQSDVLLSSARRGADTTIKLDTAVVAALAKLSAYEKDDTPFEGGASMLKRLTDGSVGTSSVGTLMECDNRGAAAARAGAENDISQSDTLEASEKTVLRQVNSAGNAANIEAIITQYRAEKAAATRLGQKAANLTKTDYAYFARKMSGARATDITTFAGLVANNSAVKSARAADARGFKEVFRQAGGLSSDDRMMRALRGAFRYAKE